jgi:hypothetical protein
MNALQALMFFFTLRTSTVYFLSVAEELHFDAAPDLALGSRKTKLCGSDSLQLIYKAQNSEVDTVLYIFMQLLHSLQQGQ